MMELRLTNSHVRMSQFARMSNLKELPDLHNKGHWTDINLSTIMKAPSAPKKITWIIGLICGLLGIIGHYAQVQILSEYNYTLLLAGFLVLAAGTTFREV
jgi:hypothetical protein